MNDVKLSVSDENLEVVLNILNNLKDGLIVNMETNGKEKARTTQYQPKANKVVYEDESGTNDSSGKYSNPAAYKQRLKNRK